MNKKERVKKLKLEIENLYKNHKTKLLFHGLHHILFVRGKALEFAKSIAADIFLAESAALVHDLNYLIKINSKPEAGKKLRKNVLEKISYSDMEIKRIEKIIMEAHTATRNKNISKEGMVLSDADSLFKILPMTPVVFSGKFIEENRIDLKKLANKICNEQNKLLKNEIYFYTSVAKKKYLNWAKLNLKLWNTIKESLNDKDIQGLISSLDKK